MTVNIDDKHLFPRRAKPAASEMVDEVIPVPLMNMTLQEPDSSARVTVRAAAELVRRPRKVQR